MRYTTLAMMLCLAIACSAWAADNGGVKPATMEKYQKARQLVEALQGTNAEKYAHEVVTDANRNIAAAQEGLKAGGEKATCEAVEMALLQVTLANAMADEQIAAEKTATTKNELEKQENRLKAILAGKGDR